MDFCDLIQLVADTAKHPMRYTVELLEEPNVQVFVEDDGRYGVNYFTHNVQCFISADDTIQFLSDHELFGWQVQSYHINNNLYRSEEMNIVLHRQRGENKWEQQ